MSFYGFNPEPRRRNVFSAKSGASAQVLGIEVTQAIQNLAHDVRLIARKKTVARVYLKPEGLPRNLRVRGELAVSSGPTTPAQYVVSQNVVSLEAADHPDLAAQRDDASLSLNFELPGRGVGPMVVRLNRVIPVTGGEDVPLGNPDLSLQVEFISAPLLRIRVLGLRFTDDRTEPARTFAPNAIHFDHLKSFLTRTYPVPELEWSQIVVDAGADVKPPFASDPPLRDDPVWARVAGFVIARLQLLRQADINAGRDPRTHYYGLVADDSGFFRGRASRVAAFADPSVVAFGPAGNPSGYPAFDWDGDASYCDWYGAHELAHTLGCRHPGCQSSPAGPPRQDRDPQSTFPYALGRLSDATEDCVGFDTGDPGLGIAMRAYPRTGSSDFMTYCDNQWVSRHIYDELLTRLQQEDEQFAPQTG